MSDHSDSDNPQFDFHVLAHKADEARCAANAEGQRMLEEHLPDLQRDLAASKAEGNTWRQHATPAHLVKWLNREVRTKWIVSKSATFLRHAFDAATELPGATRIPAPAAPPTGKLSAADGTQYLQELERWANRLEREAPVLGSADPAEAADTVDTTGTIAAKTLCFTKPHLSAGRITALSHLWRQKFSELKAAVNALDEANRHLAEVNKGQAGDPDLVRPNLDEFHDHRARYYRAVLSVARIGFHLGNAIAQTGSDASEFFKLRQAVREAIAKVELECTGWAVGGERVKRGLADAKRMWRTGRATVDVPINCEALDRMDDLIRRLELWTRQVTELAALAVRERQEENELAILRESVPTSRRDFVKWAEAHIGKSIDRRKKLLSNIGVDPNQKSEHRLVKARQAITVARELGISPTPTLPNVPMSYDELEQVFDSLRKSAVESELAEVVTPRKVEPVTNPKGDAVADVAEGVKGGTRTTWQEAMKVAENHCARNPFPGVNALMKIVRVETSRTCSKSTILKAIKHSTPLRSKHADHLAMSKSKSAGAMTERVAASTMQAREVDPAEAASTNEIFNALVQQSKEKDRARLNNMPYEERHRLVGALDQDAIDELFKPQSQSVVATGRSPRKP